MASLTCVLAIVAVVATASANVHSDCSIEADHTFHLRKLPTPNCLPPPQSPYHFQFSVLRARKNFKKSIFSTGVSPFVTRYATTLNLSAGLGVQR